MRVCGVFVINLALGMTHIKLPRCAYRSSITLCRPDPFGGSAVRAKFSHVQSLLLLGCIRGKPFADLAMIGRWRFYHPEKALRVRAIPQPVCTLQLENGLRAGTNGPVHSKGSFYSSFAV